MATSLSTPEVLKAIQEDCWEGSSESDNNEDQEDYTITDPLDIAQNSTVFTERYSPKCKSSHSLDIFFNHLSSPKKFRTQGISIPP